MKLLDTIREQLDSVEATNASKIYTPFTLFCIFFAVYFNADILGSIFLSTKWEIKSAALKTLTDRSWDIWFGFALRVISYSLGMMVLYGLAQAGAAFVWGVSSWANITLSAAANRSKYIEKRVYDDLLEEAHEVKREKMDFFERLREFGNHKPNDIDELENQVSELTKSVNEQQDDIESKKIHIEGLEKKMIHAESNHKESFKKNTYLVNITNFLLGANEGREYFLNENARRSLTVEKKFLDEHSQKKEEITADMEALGIFEGYDWERFTFSASFVLNDNKLNETAGKLLAVIEYWKLGSVEDQDLSPVENLKESYVMVSLNNMGVSILSSIPKRL